MRGITELFRGKPEDPSMSPKDRLAKAYHEHLKRRHADPVIVVGELMQMSTRVPATFDDFSKILDQDRLIKITENGRDYIANPGVTLPLFGVTSLQI